VPWGAESRRRARKETGEEDGVRREEGEACDILTRAGDSERRRGVRRIQSGARASKITPPRAQRLLIRNRARGQDDS
jgi:hypothetical protein